MRNDATHKALTTNQDVKISDNQNSLKAGKGSRGSADTVRDIRGFAIKFYTQEGNFDLVGNNVPVFFVQDGIKFPDFVHAVKPEPHTEIPTGATAHDIFLDFFSLMPESTYTVMWAMSDQAPILI